MLIVLPKRREKFYELKTKFSENYNKEQLILSFHGLVNITLLINFCLVKWGMKWRYNSYVRI